MNEALLALPRCHATPPGVRLGPLALIADGAARAFVVKVGEARFHGFAVRRGAALFGYVDRCPHAGLPLAQALDAYLSPDGNLIQCSWHGALFTVETGDCVGGPCPGRALERWPVHAVDGEMVTGAL